MPIVLCFNPGSNSLKFDLVETEAGQSRASAGKRLLTGGIDNVGKPTEIEIARGDEASRKEPLPAGDYGAMTTAALDALDKLGLPKPDLAGVRVVHGGSDFTQAVRVDEEVLRKIEARAELAPLHNPNSVKVIHALQQHGSALPVACTFDTAFHHTLPEVAWRYPIDREIAKKHGIRKYGFHGLSHRYQMEQFCYLSGTPLEDASIVTTHLESGSSVCAIRNGRSVDTSMGFTPLEGLMMGTRSGSIDPAIVPFLMEHEGMSASEALNFLEKRSGLLAISGQSLDTRILRKKTDERSLLAMAMFAYRVRAAIGAYLAVLGEARAVVFSGGIGENTPEVRGPIAEGLRGWGMQVDPARNTEVMAGDTLLSTPASKLAAWVIHADEGMQLAHECTQATQ
ncbi:acetate/propionate family kinase [Terriglobus tenax]|uniref:acetate/propionate family kinase n=1 Tax=Terriglobus tenax TaxID=1111115 RepID=UPI0021DF869C|nr:acetate/propionate family kinase [Terriglobus tenax]